MISRRIKLEDVNEGLQALKTGEVAHGVFVFDNAVRQVDRTASVFALSALSASTRT